jgi:hypothetical protein
LPLKKFAAFFVVVVGALGSSALSGEELTVHFKTTPQLKLLRPFADPADLALLVTGADGRPVGEGSAVISLHAPPPGAFFSTDYPLVEGTLLSELRLPLRQGKANWKYLFPIRGEYRLVVDVTANENRKASKSFSFHVSENPKKWLALGAFSATLFVFGFVAARVFTGKPTNRVSLVAAALLASTAGSVASQQRLASDAGLLKIEPATVGKPSEVSWSLARGGTIAGATAALSLTIAHLEKQKVVFAFDRVPVIGEWSMKFHFPDGAEYRVTAIAEVPGLAPLRAEETVSVTGIEPPAGPMIRALVYFTSLIALGLAAGRWSKRRSRSSA